MADPQREVVTRIYDHLMTRIEVTEDARRTTPGKHSCIHVKHTTHSPFVVIVADGKMAPSLMTLPEDVIRKILSYLLNAPDVRVRHGEQKGFTVDYDRESGKPVLEMNDETKIVRIKVPPRPRKYEPSYNFSSAILRVSKNLHKLGCFIFERSHFILVSTNDSRLLDSMTTLRIWHRHERISLYKAFHLRLHISMKYNTVVQSNREPPKTVFFVVCGDSLPGLLRLLRMNEIVTRPTMKLKLDFKANSDGAPLALKMQCTLLEPFRKLQGARQTAQISGVVDPRLATEMSDLLTPRLHWLRHELWELYDLASHIKILADTLSASTPATALLLYTLCLRFLHNTYIEQKLLVTDDLALCNNFRIMHSHLVLNTCKAYMTVERRSTSGNSLIHDSTIGDRIHVKARKDVFAMDPNESAIYNVWTGLCLLMISQTRQGLEALKAAAETCADFAAVYEMAQTYTKTRKALGEFTEEIRAMCDIVIQTTESFPHKTKTFSYNTKTVDELQTVVSAVDFERFVLHGSGYTGDLLLGKVKQESGCSIDLKQGKRVNQTFDVKLAEQRIGDLKELLSEKSAKGLRTIYPVLCGAYTKETGFAKVVSWTVRLNLLSPLLALETGLIIQDEPQ